MCLRLTPFRIRCRSYGAGRVFGVASYKDLAPTEPFNLLRAKPWAILFDRSAVDEATRLWSRRRCLRRGELLRRTTEGGVSHAVFAGFQVAGHTGLERRISLSFDSDIVPAVKLLQ